MQYLSDQTADQGGGSYMADQNTSNTQQGGGDQIPLSRAEYDKLMRQAARAEDLESRVKQGEQDWRHVQNLLRPNGNQEEVHQSIRQLMTKEGYSNGEIEQYISEMDEEGDDGSEGYDPEEEAARKFVHNTKNEIETLKEHTRRNEKMRLEGVLDQTVDSTVDEDSELGKLFLAIARTYEDDTDQQTNLYETMVGDVKRETLERLRIRRTREGGRWSDSWIQEEAANAAKVVHGKYRLFVPNPSKLGRSSDYSEEHDYVENTHPVKAPEYKRGMNPADVSRESRSWAIDQLLRASVDAERSSKSDSPI